MASETVIILVIILVILIIAIIAMILFYFWSIRKRIIRDNLTYLVQQGTTNSTTDIFELDNWNIYVCNRTPITITMSGSKGLSGRLYYISNFSGGKAFTIAGNGITILQTDNVIPDGSLCLYVFLDDTRLQRIF